MDPLSIAALLGIAYVGRQISQNQQVPPTERAQVQVPVAPAEFVPNDSARDLVLNQYTQPGYISEPVSKKQETGNFGDIAFSQYVHGEPTHDLSSRFYVSAQMNNLSPVEKVFVGRGLGIDPEIPASGGFQQLYRVNPNNVGAYRLTTLPGRIAPGASTTGWSQPTAGTYGDITHYAPSKTAYLPSRYPAVANRAQGQGGAVTGTTIRESYVKTKRTTKRAETGLRTDGLEYAPAKRVVPFQTTSDAPSRNKGDLNNEQFYHVDNAAPGIHSFKHGYTSDPLNQALESKNFTLKELDNVGFKVDDKRGNKDRAGNAGRMNVRAGPLQQGGILTAVRSDSDKRTDNYFGHAGTTTNNNGHYINDQYYTFNAYKGQPGPASASDLNVARKQLANNPFAHTLSGPPCPR
jgi:hypothetical protein